MRPLRIAMHIKYSNIFRRHRARFSVQIIWPNVVLKITLFKGGWAFNIPVATLYLLSDPYYSNESRLMWRLFTDTGPVGTADLSSLSLCSPKRAPSISPHPRPLPLRPPPTLSHVTSCPNVCLQPVLRELFPNFSWLLPLWIKPADELPPSRWNRARLPGASSAAVVSVSIVANRRHADTWVAQSPWDWEAVCLIPSFQRQGDIVPWSSGRTLRVPSPNDSRVNPWRQPHQMHRACFTDPEICNL